MNQYTWALIGTGITFLATALGAATVFVLSKPNDKLYRGSMGFAAGIMVAAAVFSLLIPSVEMAEAYSPEIPAILPAAVGFVLGGLFLFALDRLIPHIHVNAKKAEGLRSGMSKSTLLFSAVTLHNIPEGMAVGLAFALAFQSEAVTFASAFALAAGMALQNFPEGAAISLPLRQEGFSKKRSFLFGALSGVVEPIGGILIVLLSAFLTHVLPYFLSFAAGAMLYVVVEELIPASKEGEHSNLGVLTFMAGFVLMMVLDIVLG